MSMKHKTTTEPTRSTPDTGSGVGSLFIAAFAAVGAAAIVLQLGGCASGQKETDPTAGQAAAESEWNSPNYRVGWYEGEEEAEEAGFVYENAPTDTPMVETVVQDPTMLGDSNAVRVSLFPDFAPLDASDNEAPGQPSGDVNLAQVSFAAEGSDFDPDVSWDGEWMVFASTQHHDQPDLYRKSIDGRVVTQLTADPSQDLMPEISPDGRYVAFASDRHGNWDVFVMSAEGGPVTQVTSDGAHELHPTWSPDGNRLCYCRFNERTTQWELWTLEVDKPGVRSFVCEGMFPRWSPDKTTDKVLFQRSRKRGDRLYGVWTIDLVDGDGMNPTEIVAAGDVAVMHPTWSPDGSSIAYTVVAEPSVAEDGMPVECDIWTIDADGTDRIALTAGGYRNLRPNWGADDRIYFMSNRGGLDVIWAISSGDQPASFEAMAEASEEYEDQDLQTTSGSTVAGVDSSTDGE